MPSFLVWHMLLLLTTHSGAPELCGRLQLTLWPPPQHALCPKCLCQRSQHGLRCLCTFVSTFSLSLLRQRQHLQETRTFPYSQPIQHCSRPQSTLSHTTPSSSRSPSATLSTPAHTSQIEKNGQAPQIVMLVITRKNKNRRLPHLLYEHSRA